MEWMIGMTTNKQAKQHARSIQAETGKSYADAKRISSALFDIRDVILRQSHDPALAQFQIMDVLRSAGVEMDTEAERDSAWVMLVRACELTDPPDTPSHRMALKWVVDQAGAKPCLRLVASAPRVADTLANLYEDNGTFVLLVHGSLEMADENMTLDIVHDISKFSPGITHSMDSSTLRIRRENLDTHGLVRLMERTMQSFAYRIPF